MARIRGSRTLVSEWKPAGSRDAPDFVGGFLAWSFITSLDIAALFGSAEGQLIGALIVSLLDMESREQRLAW